MDTSHIRMTTLDGMRGAAAVCVVLHHAWPQAMGVAALSRGYLAVDFFFMLSGFVMTRTYEDRFRAGWSVGRFMAVRLRRLYPVMAAGIIAGAAVAVVGGVPIGAILPLLLAELMFVPSLGGGPNGIYRFDGVQWSLLFELLANVAHASVIRRMTTRALSIAIILSLVALAMVARDNGSIAVGDRATTVFAGVPRVLFPYLIGVLLARKQAFSTAFAQIQGGYSCIVLLVLTLVIAGWIPIDWPGWLIELAIVALVFPILIVWGSTVALSDVASSLARNAGSLSYPLYAMHLPMITLVFIAAGSGVHQGPVLLVAGLAAAFAGAIVVRNLDAGQTRPQSIFAAAGAKPAAIASPPLQ